MSKYELNTFNTTHLTLNVMAHCARVVGQDINDDDVANVMYDICCDLESWPEDEGFGSSDHYSYVNSARAHYGQTTHQDFSEAMTTVARFLSENTFMDDHAHAEIERLANFFRKQQEAA